MRAHREIPNTNDILKAWQPFKALIGVTRVNSVADYEKANTIIAALLNAVGDNESHPLADVLDMLSDQVQAWEATHTAIPVADSAELLRFLMDEHSLRQSDLSDCAPQSRISDYLAGRRAISKAVAKRLAERFSVSADLFM